MHQRRSVAPARSRAASTASKACRLEWMSETIPMRKQQTSSPGAIKRRATAIISQSVPRHNGPGIKHYVSRFTPSAAPSDALRASARARFYVLRFIHSAIRNPYSAFVLAGLAALALYVRTLAPTVLVGDSGEFQFTGA